MNLLLLLKQTSKPIIHPLDNLEDLKLKLVLKVKPLHQKRGKGFHQSWNSKYYLVIIEIADQPERS